jgi:hypothetical protein
MMMLSSNEKHVRLLELALDRKREILSLPLPDKSDDSVEANRLRALVLNASDTTISQAISLQSLASGEGKNAVAEEVEAFIKARRQMALRQIEMMNQER